MPAQSTYELAKSTSTKPPLKPPLRRLTRSELRLVAGGLPGNYGTSSGGGRLPRP
jgi:hypothetical protein